MSKFLEYNVYERPITSANQLEIFSRAVLAQFFTPDNHCEFPDTFYLDEDRLRTLKAEIEDLVRLEVCTDVFTFFLRQLKYDGDVSPTMRQQIRSSVVAIMGDAMGYGASQWISNSEALALELLRQAFTVSGQTWTPNHATLSIANEHLLRAFHNAPMTHNARLRATLLHKLTTSVQRHANSNPVDLFNSLAPPVNASLSSPTTFLSLYSGDKSASLALNPETAKWQDIANRITHIVLFHWKVWKDIAYVPQELPTTATPYTSSSQPEPSDRPQSQATDREPSLMPSMHTGEPPDAGPDTHTAHEMQSQ